MEGTDGRYRSTEPVDALRQVLALAIASYPVLLPLFGQFKDDFSEGLDRVAETLPQITEVLRRMEKEAGEFDRHNINSHSQLTEILPELGKFFQKAT